MVRCWRTVQICGEAHPLRMPVLLGYGRLLNAIGQTEAGVAKAKEVGASVLALWRAFVAPHRSHVGRRGPSMKPVGRVLTA